MLPRSRRHSDLHYGGTMLRAGGQDVAIAVTGGPLTVQWGGGGEGDRFQKGNVESVTAHILNLTIL